jgi:hypothetical protein
LRINDEEPETWKNQTHGRTKIVTVEQQKAVLNRTGLCGAAMLLPAAVVFLERKLAIITAKLSTIADLTNDKELLTM